MSNTCTAFLVGTAIGVALGCALCGAMIYRDWFGVLYVAGCLLVICAARVWPVRR